MRSIDFEQRLRLGENIFTKEPESLMGAIVVAEQFASRSNPKKILFGGHVVRINHTGVSSSVLLRTSISGVIVEKNVLQA